jgi:hypothetical protein
VARALSEFAELLQDRRFLKFLLSGALAFGGPACVLIILQTSIALAYAGSHAAFSALTLSWLGLSATVPTLAAAVFSGTLADRYDRGRLLWTVGAVALAAVAAIVVVLRVAPLSAVAVPGPAGFTIPLALLLTFPLWGALTVAVTLFRPAYNSVLPGLVPVARLSTANSLFYGVSVAFSAVAQVLTGSLVARSGAVVALAVPIVLFAGSELLLLRPVAAAGRPKGRGRPFLEEVQAGYRYLGSRRELLSVTVGALLINFLTALAFVELAAYSAFRLGEDPAFLGILYAAGTVGGGAGALLITRIPFERRLGRVLGVLTVGMGGCLLVLGLTRSPAVAVADLFLFGMFPAMFQVAFMAGVQATVPNELLGRVFAADEVGSLAFVPVGQYAGGLLTFEAGLVPTYLGAGAGMALVGAGLGFVPAVGRFRFDPSPVTIPPGALGEPTPFPGPHREDPGPPPG